jgi:hypothetical protein
MDEPPVSRNRAGKDADAPLGRDDSDWFWRQLGEEWQPEEPGIYRFVGPTSSSGGLESGLEGDTSESSATHDPERRWALRRRR